MYFILISWVTNINSLAVNDKDMLLDMLAKKKKKRILQQNCRHCICSKSGLWRWLILATPLFKEFKLFSLFGRRYSLPTCRTNRIQNVYVLAVIGPWLRMSQLYHGRFVLVHICLPVGNQVCLTIAYAGCVIAGPSNMPVVYMTQQFHQLMKACCCAMIHHQIWMWYISAWCKTN